MTTSEAVLEFLEIVRLAAEGAEDAGNENFGYALAKLRTLRDKITEATEAVHDSIAAHVAPKIPTSAPEEREP